ncbi:MAG: hypothetical protein CMF78_00565 [Candidatus Marinimicrobia bacterium]|jgi:hypothetical protein|nr:hypothetical protein [Candidatus Neomarinimicrobiota bacterium]
MNIRSDMNARTAMVYGGAAFLLIIIGFRSIFATLDPDHIGVMTYLSIGGLVLEFFLLMLYAHSIYNLGPDGGGESNASVGNMDGKEISELTAAVIKVAQMGEGLSNLASGKVRDEVRKEVNDILSKAIKK